MSDPYQNDIFNSDVDTYKQSGILADQINIGGTLGAGAEVTFLSSIHTIDTLDFAQILFDNSFYHSGKYRNLALENATMVNETTLGSQLQCNVFQLINGNTIQFGGTMFNPYSSAVNLSTTVVHFQYTPFQSTF